MSLERKRDMVSISFVEIATPATNQHRRLQVASALQLCNPIKLVRMQA